MRVLDRNTNSGMALVHPSEVLCEELAHVGLSASDLADAVDVPVSQATAILNGDHVISADIALRLGHHFDTTTQFWHNLQREYQVCQAETRAGALVL